MPVSNESEMIRFALPKTLADEIRELQRGLGERDPKPGKFFRDRAADVIQRERQRQADGKSLQSIRADVGALGEKVEKFLGVFQRYASFQTDQVASSLQLIAEQLESLNQQVSGASFLSALNRSGKKESGK